MKYDILNREIEVDEMSCKFKIKEAKASFTTTEQRIADYILTHREETINASAQEMAEVTQTSPAALIRFSQKLGYKGFTALKVDLAKDHDDLDQDFDELIAQEDTIDVLIRKAQCINQQTSDQTYKLINVANLEKAIQALLHGKTIYLFGIGGSGNVCNDFMHKMTRINRNIVYHEDSHILLARIAHINSDDVAIAVSYSGETSMVNTAMKYAKSVGATTIGITQFNPRSSLSRIVDIVLNTPVQEKQLRLGAIASRNASLILTDLLYYGVAKADLEKTKADLVKTRELTDEFK